MLFPIVDIGFGPFGFAKSPEIKPYSCNAMLCEIMGQVCSPVDVGLDPVEQCYNCFWPSLFGVLPIGIESIKVFFRLPVKDHM